MRHTSFPRASARPTSSVLGQHRRSASATDTAPYSGLPVAAAEVRNMARLPRLLLPMPACNAPMRRLLFRSCALSVCSLLCVQPLAAGLLVCPLSVSSQHLLCPCSALAEQVKDDNSSTRQRLVYFCCRLLCHWCLRALQLVCGSSQTGRTPVVDQSYTSRRPVVDQS